MNFQNNIPDEILKSFKYCEDISKNHYENFPVASLVLPVDLRKYIYVFYAFARTADDIADSIDLTEYEKYSKLQYLENEIEKIHNGISDFQPEYYNLLTALQFTQNKFNIPVTEYKSLIIAFKQDVKTNRYENISDIFDYSKLSANPVGHILLYLFGYNIQNDNILFEYSDYICTALQLTNFWQDVSKDLDLNRIYIPSQYFIKHKYSERELKEKVYSFEFQMLMKDLIDITENLYLKGFPLTKYFSGKLKIELKLIIYGGIAILNKIRKFNYNVFNNEVKINTFNKISILFKAIYSNIE